MRSSAEDCERRCAQDNDCVAFTFKKKVLDCHLLDETSEHKANADADSGVKRQPQ